MFCSPLFSILGDLPVPPHLESSGLEFLSIQPKVSAQLHSQLFVPKIQTAIGETRLKWSLITLGVYLLLNFDFISLSFLVVFLMNSDILFKTLCPHLLVVLSQRNAMKYLVYQYQKQNSLPVIFKIQCVCVCVFVLETFYLVFISDWPFFMVSSLFFTYVDTFPLF